MTEAQRIKNLQVPSGRIDCVLDTDTYNEIDDQFALSFMVKSDKCNVKALIAAPFSNKEFPSPKEGMERSYEEILNLLTLLEREDLKKCVYKGSESYLSDEKTPVISEGAQKLAELADGYTAENPLYVVAIGAITNVASAILLKPEITEKIVLVWLGGHSESWPDTNEYNMMQDIAGARIVFGCGCPLVQLPCMGVVSAFTISGPELEYWLKGVNPICDYLAKHTIESAETYAKGRVWSRAIWDVTAVAWLLNDGDRFMFSELISSPVPEYDHHYGKDYRRHLIRRVTWINRDGLFQALIDCLRK